MESFLIVLKAATCFSDSRQREYLRPWQRLTSYTLLGLWYAIGSWLVLSFCPGNRFFASLSTALLLTFLVNWIQMRWDAVWLAELRKVLFSDAARTDVAGSGHRVISLLLLCSRSFLYFFLFSRHLEFWLVPSLIFEGILALPAEWWSLGKERRELWLAVMVPLIAILLFRKNLGMSSPAVLWALMASGCLCWCLQRWNQLPRPLLAYLGNYLFLLAGVLAAI